MFNLSAITLMLCAEKKVDYRLTVVISRDGIRPVRFIIVSGVAQFTRDESTL